MATQTGSYDFKAAKAAHDEASQTASNYITEITDDGIMVHAEGDGPDDTQTPSGWHISDVLEYIRNGISRFWIGLKNQGDTTPTVRIGKDYVSGASDNESHMELDYRSLKLVDKNNNTYLYASDLRDASGVATIKEIYVPDGIYYYLTSNALDTDYVVKIDGVVAPATKSITGFTVSSSDVEGASEVSVEYTTADEKAKAYTLGVRINALGCFSVAEGYNVSAVGGYSHAEGEQTRATGRHAHSEGYYTEARGVYSHAEGRSSTAVGESSHAEGNYTYAGKWAHSEGSAAYASGIASHAQNYMTRAASNFQTALGKCNVEDANDTYVVIVGNGTNDSNRSNALTVDWGGKATLYSGNITDGTAPAAATNGTGGVLLVDKNGAELGYVRPRFYANGTQYYDMGASRNVNGSTVTHGLMLGIDASGKKNVTLDYDSWRTALEIVNILTLKSPSTSSAKIDTSANNGATSSAVVFGRTEIMDKNGTWVSTYGSNTQTNGQTRSYIGCNNMKTDGTMATNYLNIGVNKDGSRFYAMTDPAAFRTALGFGDGTWETQDDTGSAVSVANSSWAKLTQVTLTAGHWLILVGGYAASNSTGRRGFHLSSASSATASRFLTTLMAPPSGAALYTVIPYLVNPTASTTYNIFGYQNSGGNLNMSALVRAIHIYTA